MAGVGNLAEKLAQVRREMGSLNPDKTNKDQNYKYISADKILERAGDALANAGITIIPSVESKSFDFVERVGKSSRIDANVVFSFLITDGVTEYKAMWVGNGSDYTSPDKALYKAITSGHKYFLMKVLNIGIGNEDGEHEEQSGTGTGKTEKNEEPIDEIASAFNAESVKICIALGGAKNAEVMDIVKSHTPDKTANPNKIKNADKARELLAALTAYAESVTKKGE